MNYICDMKQNMYYYTVDTPTLKVAARSKFRRINEIHLSKLQNMSLWFTLQRLEMFSSSWYLFYLISSISALHCGTKRLIDITLSEEDWQSIDARSPIECILKCRTRFKKKGFYTKDNLCFCTDGIFETAFENVDGLEGNLYLEREIQGKLKFHARCKQF